MFIERLIHNLEQAIRIVDWQAGWVDYRRCLVEKWIWVSGRASYPATTPVIHRLPPGTKR